MKDFKLDSHPKITSGFQIPENYFDTLSLNKMQKTAAEQKPIISLHRRKMALWYAVAAILVITLMIPIFNYYNNPLRQVDEAALESYLSYQTNFNQYDLINELDANDVSQLNKKVTLEEESIEDLLAANPNIENYLSE